MPPKTIDTVGMRLSQMADQHEQSNNPAYYAWMQKAMADGMDREAARRHAAEAVYRFGNNPPMQNAAKQVSRDQDEDVAPPRTSPPTAPGRDEDIPQPKIEVATPTVSVSAPSVGSPGALPPLDLPRRLDQAAGQRMSSTPSMSQEDAAAIRAYLNQTPPGSPAAPAQAAPSGPLPGAITPIPDPRLPAAASPPPAPPTPQPPDSVVQQMVEKMVSKGLSREQAQAAVDEKYPRPAAPPPQAPSPAATAASPPPVLDRSPRGTLIWPQWPTAPLPQRDTPEGRAAAAEAEAASQPIPTAQPGPRTITPVRPERPSAPAAQPAPAGPSNATIQTADKNNDGRVSPDEYGKWKEAAPPRKNPSAEDAAVVREMQNQSRRPGMSRDERVDATVRAMAEMEKRSIMREQGVEEYDAAQMVNMETIRRAAEGQVAGEISDEGLTSARERAAEQARRAVTATGPQAAQMASEEAITKRILNQNQNARTRGLGGQNRLWDENDPETRAMVAQQIASEEKASNERAIADTGLGTRRVPTPAGAGGERSKQGTSFASADDAANYARREADAPTLGPDGLPVGGKPGLYKPSQKDLDMAKRGMVPVYGPRGEIGYAVAAFSEPENGAPGAPGRAGHRPDLEKAGYYVEERMGPTGKQSVYVPGSDMLEKQAGDKRSGLIERLRQNAGLSTKDFIELRNETEAEGEDLLERLRMLGKDNRNQAASVRAGKRAAQAELGGLNPVKNAVNAYNQLDPEWKNTVGAKALRPDLSGTTPNDVAAARAKDGGRNDDLIARLSMFETQQKQAGLDRQADKDKHEADMQMRQQTFDAAMKQQAHTNELDIEKLRAEIQRNQQQAAGPMAQADLARQNAEDIKKQKDLQDTAARTGLPIGAIQDIRDGRLDSPMTRAALAKAVGESDSTWVTMGSGYSDDDEAKFKGIMRSAGVEDEAQLELLFEKAKHARYKASLLGFWNWR